MDGGKKLKHPDGDPTGKGKDFVSFGQDVLVPLNISVNPHNFKCISSLEIVQLLLQF